MNPNVESILLEKIATLEAKNADLENRLQLSMHIDEIQKNQALDTLKNDLSKSLALEYADYNDSKNEPCNNDNYIARGASLCRIFKTLARHGIKL